MQLAKPAILGCAYSMSLNHDGTTSAATRLGFEAGQIIQEYYFDDDADMALRAQLEEALGSQLVDEDYADVVDGAIAWWREEDGGVDELTDLLVDVAANLDGEGLIWVFTPKARSAGAVSPIVVEEAAGNAGMHATSARQVSDAWSGVRISSRRK